MARPAPLPLGGVDGADPRRARANRAASGRAGGAQSHRRLSRPAGSRRRNGVASRRSPSRAPLRGSLRSALSGRPLTGPRPLRFLAARGCARAQPRRFKPLRPPRIPSARTKPHTRKRGEHAPEGVSCPPSPPTSSTRYTTSTDHSYCWVRGRIGDAVTAKSQRFTQGDLVGPGRVGR